MSRGWQYHPGDWWLLCDVCDKKVRASESKQRWDGLIVCKDDYEMRHPQDFIRVRPDKISIPFSRPRGTDQFVTVTLNTAITDTIFADDSSFAKTVTIIPLNLPITSGNTSNQALGMLTLGSIVLGGAGTGSGFTETVLITDTKPAFAVTETITESQSLSESVTIYHVYPRALGLQTLGISTLGL